jgi:glycosyltransferase involved in cell wall biosynthesis
VNNNLQVFHCESPKFSIITVVLNGEKYLEQTIKSVITQYNTNYELIIIDGGSTDRSVDIIQKYDKQIAKWISEPDSGIYNAMNKGLKFAQGDLISFLNSDDYYLPDTLFKVAQTANKIYADIYHGNVMKLPRHDNIEKAIAVKATNNIRSLGKGEYIYQPATFMRNDIFRKIGMFNEKLRIVSDYDFFLRAEKNRCSFHHIDQTLTVFRTGGISTSYKSYIEGFHLLRYYGTFNDYTKNLKLLIRSYVNHKKRGLSTILRSALNK